MKIQGSPQRSRRGDRTHWIIVALAVAAVAGPIVYWLAGTSEAVPTSGPSMRPTLAGHGSVKVDYHAYDHAGPEVGDVVILQGPVLKGDPCSTVPPRGSSCPEPAHRYGDVYLVKRIVAAPGDQIAFAADGHAIRNGRRQAETFIRTCRPRDSFCALPRPITVPAKHYFVAGDNRRNSTDSRDFGPVPVDAVDGRVILEDEAR